MRKKLFEFISELLNAVPQNPIKHINLWNNQIAFIEEEQPFNCPAVFIEFNPIEWRPLSRGVYEAAATFVLHIVTDSRVGNWQDAIDVFDLIDSISSRIRGSGSAELGIGSITRVSSTTDSLFGELMHNQEAFSCHIIDKSGCAVPQRVAATGAVTTGILP